MSGAGKPLDPSVCEDYCIHIDGEEVQCDHDFQCPSCGFHNEPTPPTNRGACTYGRICPGCGKRYGIYCWTEERAAR